MHRVPGGIWDRFRDDRRHLAGQRAIRRIDGYAVKVRIDEAHATTRLDDAFHLLDRSDPIGQEQEDSLAARALKVLVGVGNRASIANPKFNSRPCAGALLCNVNECRADVDASGKTARVGKVPRVYRAKQQTDHAKGSCRGDIEITYRGD